MAIKLIGYLSYGYPSIAESLERAKLYRAAGCRCLEVDFPTDNPFLDNALIQSRMRHAYGTCRDFEAYFDGIRQLRSQCPDVELLGLAYEHTILEMGLEFFISRYLASGLSDLILVGTQDGHLKQQLMEHGIRVASYVTFAMSQKELLDADTANGFVYMQAKPSTPSTDGPSLASCIADLRRRGISLPIYCGGGVAVPEDIEMIRQAGGNGAFLGSALLHQADEESVRTYLHDMLKAAEDCP